MLKGTSRKLWKTRQGHGVTFPKVAEEGLKVSYSYRKAVVLASTQEYYLQRSSHIGACHNLGIKNPDVPRFPGMPRFAKLHFWQLIGLLIRLIYEGGIIADVVDLERHGSFLNTFYMWVHRSTISIKWRLRRWASQTSCRGYSDAKSWQTSRYVINDSLISEHSGQMEAPFRIFRISTMERISGERWWSTHCGWFSTYRNCTTGLLDLEDHQS